MTSVTRDVDLFDRHWFVLYNGEVICVDVEYGAMTGLGE